MAERRNRPDAPLRPVSVVLPVRNEAETIEESVLSVLHQSFSDPLDVIVVDGASSDSTPDIVNRIAQIEECLVPKCRHSGLPAPIGILLYRAKDSRSDAFMCRRSSSVGQTIFWFPPDSASQAELP